MQRQGSASGWDIIYPLGQIHFCTPGAKSAGFPAVSFFSTVSDTEKIFRWKFKHFVGKCLGFLTSLPLGLTSPSGGQKFHPRKHQISPAIHRKLQNFSIFLQFSKINKSRPRDWRPEVRENIIFRNIQKKTNNIFGKNTKIGDLTYWLPLSDKRLVPTAPLVARFWLWTGIVKPTEVVESNGIDQINGATFF